VAYGGRAAAYEKKGELDRALADYNMLVFSYAVELDAADSQADSYAELVKEAARAYRARAACYKAKGQAVAMQRDLKRAETLEAKVKKPGDQESPAAKAGTLPGRVTVQNEWADPVTIVIAGVTYTLPPGKAKMLATPAGSFPFEMVAGPHRVTGTIDAGKTYRVKPPPEQAP
jgi:hypothetical protein